MRAGEAAHRIVESLAGSHPVVEVVVVASPGERPPVGTRLLVWSDRVEGTLGSGTLDEEAVRRAREVLDSRAAARIDLETPGGPLALYLEPHVPPEELIIVGAGHIARPLCQLGAMLGFRVTVLDDRPEFATRERFPDAARVLEADFTDPFRDIPLGASSYLVLVTRGHKYDYEALRDILRRDLRLAYIGMVGSQRRVRAAFEQLIREDIPAERLATVHAPIGLDIGAETPEEIALSIAGELVRARRGGTGIPLRDRARVVERWISSARKRSAEKAPYEEGK